MRRKVLFDTNILIALSKDRLDSARFSTAFGKVKRYISVITKIELLSGHEAAGFGNCCYRRYLQSNAHQ